VIAKADRFFTWLCCNRITLCFGSSLLATRFSALCSMVWHYYSGEIKIIKSLIISTVGTSYNQELH